MKISLVIKKYYNFKFTVQILFKLKALSILLTIFF